MALLLPYSGLRPLRCPESAAAAAATTTSSASCHNRWQHQQHQQQEYQHCGTSLLVTSNRCGRDSAFDWTWRTMPVAAHDDHGVSRRVLSRAFKAQCSNRANYPLVARAIIASLSSSSSSSSCSEVAVDNSSDFSQLAPPSSSSEQSSSGKQFTVRGAQLDEELWAAAWIRAECYFEDQPLVRYLDSYKKHFAEQEFIALKRRVLGNYGQCVKCICLVAISHEQQFEEAPLMTCGGPDSEAELERVVIGSLDLSIRQFSPGESFPGECIAASTSEGNSTTTTDGTNHEPSHRYGYIANVSVAKPGRRNGVASELVGAGIEAAKDWGLTEVFVHVDFDNEAACRLYSKHKFEARQAGVVQIDNQSAILLQRSL